MPHNMAAAYELTGRMEKRLPIAIVVHLARVHEDFVNSAELTYTENVSAHGACVVSRRFWDRGEIASVTAFKEPTALQGKVVSCRKYGSHQYAVSLTFQKEQVTWSAFRNYATG